MIITTIDLEVQPDTEGFSPTQQRNININIVFKASFIQQLLGVSVFRHSAISTVIIQMKVK